MLVFRHRQSRQLADKERLLPGVELNDEIINFYLAWLQTVSASLNWHYLLDLPCLISHSFCLVEMSSRISRLHHRSVRSLHGSIRPTEAARPDDRLKIRLHSSPEFKKTNSSAAQRGSLQVTDAASYQYPTESLDWNRSRSSRHVSFLSSTPCEETTRILSNM